MININYQYLSVLYTYWLLTLEEGDILLPVVILQMSYIHRRRFNTSIDGPHKLWSYMGSTRIVQWV